jgi:hypothetical protein
MAGEAADGTAGVRCPLPVKSVQSLRTRYFRLGLTGSKIEAVMGLDGVLWLAGWVFCQARQGREGE